MTDKPQTILSPVGEIISMGVDKGRVDKFKQAAKGDENLYKHVKLLFDTNNPGVSEFKAKIKAINPKLIGTESKQITKDSQFTVGARSQFDIELLGPNGEKVEDPTQYKFGANSTGTAQMVVQPNTQGINGSIYLKSLGIHSFNQGEVSDKKVDVNMEGLRQSLRAAASQGS